MIRIFGLVKKFQVNQRSGSPPPTLSPSSRTLITPNSKTDRVRPGKYISLTGQSDLPVNDTDRAQRGRSNCDLVY